MRTEDAFRAYVARNLDKIDPGLTFVREEYAIPGGRIDIFARDTRGTVGLELKARPYDPHRACGQVLHYLRAVDTVYFVAPQIVPRLASLLEAQARADLVRFVACADSRFSHIPIDDALAGAAADPSSGRALSPALTRPSHALPARFADALLASAGVPRRSIVRGLLAHLAKS